MQQIHVDLAPDLSCETDNRAVPKWFREQIDIKTPASYASPSNYRYRRRTEMPLDNMLIPHMVLQGGCQIRTVLDTNILYSALYSNRGASHQVLKAVLSKDIHPVMSVTLLFEYEDVLKRNSRKLGIKHSDVDALLDVFCTLCSLHKIHYLWRPYLPDPKDDHVLELAVASGVNTITTFDRADFKGVEKFGVQVISPQKLLEEIKWEH